MTKDEEIILIKQRLEFLKSEELKCEKNIKKQEISFKLEELNKNPSKDILDIVKEIKFN